MTHYATDISIGKNEQTEEMRWAHQDKTKKKNEMVQGEKNL